MEVVIAYSILNTKAFQFDSLFSARNNLDLANIHQNYLVEQ